MSRFSIILKPRRRFSSAATVPGPPFASRLTRSRVFTLSLAALLSISSSIALAQTQAEGSTWSHLAVLPSNTRVHVAADRMNKTCLLVSVDDQKLVCSTRKNFSGTTYTFVRAEVKSVKLTRYRRSTLVGVGVGAGVGLGVGAIVGQVISPQTNSWLDLSGLVRAVVTGIGGVGGLLAGGVIGATTDSLRGPTVYQRQEPKQ